MPNNVTKRTRYTRIAAAAALSPLAIALLILVIGGGVGQKDALPPHLAHGLAFAHRGGATLATPENCLESMASVDGKGFEGIEVDVQKSKDGQFFLFHDRDTARLLGLPGIASDRTVAELKSSPLILQDLSFRKSSAHVTTLNDALDKYGRKYVFYFDMKGYGSSSPFELADEIAALIESRGLEDYVLVASSNFLFAAYLEYRHPRIRTVLEGFDPEKRAFLSWIPVRFRADFIAGPEEELTRDFAAWLTANDMAARYIPFAVTIGTLDYVRSLGMVNFMVDYDPRMDALLKEHGAQNSTR